MFIVRDTPPTFEEVAGYVAQSVVAIAVGMRQDDSPNIVGTGFALEWAEYFATCWHVAKEDDRIRQLTQEGLAQGGLKDRTLRIALRSGDTYVWREVEPKTWMRGFVEEHDVCIYRVIGVAVPPLHVLAEDKWNWGSEVGIVGFPMGSILQGNVLRPYVLRTVIAGGLEMPLPNGAQTPRLALGTTAAGGFSGSPVFAARDGQVVGMVASKVLEWDGSGQTWPAGISLAVTPSLLRQGLHRLIGITTDTIKKSLRSYLK